MTQKWTSVVSHRKHVFLLQSSFGEEAAWYYISVFPQKLALFKSRIGKESLDLMSYGEILYSGRGKEPPEAIRLKVER